MVHAGSEIILWMQNYSSMGHGAVFLTDSENIGLKDSKKNQLIFLISYQIILSSCCWYYIGPKQKCIYTVHLFWLWKLTCLQIEPWSKCKAGNRKYSQTLTVLSLNGVQFLFASTIEDHRIIMDSNLTVYEHMRAVTKCIFLSYQK